MKPDLSYPGLEFTELTHTYKYNGAVKSSVSNYLKQFIHPFDVIKESNRVALRDNLNPDELRRDWKMDNFFGITKGNKIHFFAEEITDIKKGIKLIPKDEWQAGVIQFWIDLPKHYIIVYSELRMYSWYLDICGTCDILLYNTITGKFVLADYKTNKSLFTSFKSLKLFPYNIPDSNYNKYRVQLSLYEIMLNEIGIELEDRWLIWTKRTNNSLYQTYSVPSLKEDIKFHHANTSRSNFKDRIAV